MKTTSAPAKKLARKQAADLARARRKQAAVLAATWQQRVDAIENSLAQLNAAALRLEPVRKDWRAAVGKLRDTPQAREADRLGREFRARQNKH